MGFNVVPSAIVFAEGGGGGETENLHVLDVYLPTPIQECAFV